MAFDDLDTTAPSGDQLNQGFESFSNSMYTSFVTMTTGNLPDVMIPSYSQSAWFLLLWIPFMFLAGIIFTNVILAQVYNIYSDCGKTRFKTAAKQRKRGITKVFRQLNDMRPAQGSRGDAAITIEEFGYCVRELRAFKKMDLDESFIKLIFSALDDDGNNVLTAKEFEDMVDVLQYSFSVTSRDGWLRAKLRGTNSGKMFDSLMDKTKGEEAEDQSMGARFDDSHFDRFVDNVLLANTAWIIIQSVFDLNDMHEPNWFIYVDVFFSFIYVFDVAFKVSYWSWGEYWFYYANRFDFIVAAVLAGAATIFLSPIVISRDVLRYLNMLRLLRMLKFLSSLDIFSTMCNIIAHMIVNCAQVIMLNSLAIYLWAWIGTTLFGGLIYKGNPDLGDFDDNNYWVYNYNDWLSAAVTHYFMMLCTWVDPITTGCVALFGKWSFEWFVAYMFFYSFYLASPLLAFNTFVSFAIDVYTKLSDEDAKPEPSEIETNLKKIQAEMIKEGQILHIGKSHQLERYQMLADVLDLDDELDSDDENAAADKDLAPTTGGDILKQKDMEIQELKQRVQKAEMDCKQARQRLEEDLHWMSDQIGRNSVRLKK
jgi:hypothetical protein